MEFICKPSRLQGCASIPGSKSHTIRAVVIAGLADGESVVEAPLVSADTRSAAAAMNALGARVDCSDPDRWLVAGCAGVPHACRETIDVANSGTTLRVLLGVASLLREGGVRLTGDEQIRRRPAEPLARALNQLGADVTSVRGNGCAPFDVRGTLRGGETSVECMTSQYLTSLLLVCPLASGETVLEVPLLNEAPYVQLTLDWLSAQRIKVEHDRMRTFGIAGGQAYSRFRRRMPADFSSATFLLGAGALPGNRITCLGLDMQDSQPDRVVVEYVRRMGAAVSVEGSRITVAAERLEGGDFDLNRTPDALPLMAVLGCLARGETVLRNVAHARIKGTDRIAVMAGELRKMGAEVRELEDGLVVRECRLTGAVVDGHHDHRIVMALAVAGMVADGETIVRTAEAAGVTFPRFAELMSGLGGRIQVAE